VCFYRFPSSTLEFQWIGKPSDEAGCIKVATGNKLYPDWLIFKRQNLYQKPRRVACHQATYEAADENLRG